MSLRALQPSEAPDFRRAAGDVIAQLLPADRRDGSLTPALLLSASLRRCGLDHDLDLACEELLVLRSGLLAASPAVDAAHEPVPLVVGDRRLALLNLTAYLDDLLERAARADARGREEVLATALDRLDGP
jgi:hypothetical protein